MLEYSDQDSLRDLFSNRGQTHRYRRRVTRTLIEVHSPSSYQQSLQTNFHRTRHGQKFGNQDPFNQKGLFGLNFGNDDYLCDDEYMNGIIYVNCGNEMK